MMNAHAITKEFEAALCEYTGAKYAVVVNSCTMAILLCHEWYLKDWGRHERKEFKFSTPKKTYVSVPMCAVLAGATPSFRDEDWIGCYRIYPSHTWDYARKLTSGMYKHGQFQCVSFHASKILADTQGGAILHDNEDADKWFRKARFDGRTEGVAPKDDYFDMIGWHCYMSPDVAARLLWKLSVLPKHNAPLPNDDYPDLSQMEIFK